MTDRDIWGAICEDANCLDPLHPTVEELLAVVRKNSAPTILEAIEDIIEHEYTKYINERTNGNA